MLDPNRDSGRFERQSSVQVVRSALTLLAGHHPLMKPDDVAYLPEDLLDWDQLVKVDFVAEWRETAERLLAGTHEYQRVSGSERQRILSEASPLQALVREAARGGEDEVSRLSCAAIILGNLIADQIYETHQKLAEAIQLQVNSFWNAGANKALTESMTDSPDADGPKTIISFLPLYMPKAPELSEDEVERDGQ